MNARAELCRDMGLALAGAAMMLLAAPPLDAWPLGLVAWIPLALISAKHMPARAGLLGWCQGTVAQGIALISVGPALRDTVGAKPLASVVGIILLALYEGARFGVVALGAAWMRKRGWPLVLAFPLLLAVSERVYPMFFPWSSALLFHGVPVLLQTADLGGTMSISLWVGITNVSLALAWTRRKHCRELVRFFVIPPALMSAVVGYGALRMYMVGRRAGSAPRLTVGLVQGDIEHADERSVDPLPIYREASREILRKEKVDLLVWPETAAGRIVRSDTLDLFLSGQVFGHHAGRSGVDASLTVPILFGVILERVEDETPGLGAISAHRPRYYNSAILSAPPGRLLGLYDKRNLVLLGEYLPYESALPWLRVFLPSAGTFSAGDRTSALLLPTDTRILPLICFEDILADRVRASVLETEPDVLINLTSNAWFGVSRLASLHLAIAQLRAVEHRRFLVHATNTGVTAVVDPVGRVTTCLEEHARATATASIQCLRGVTIYGTLGSWLKWLLVASALSLAVLRPPRAKA